MKRLIPGLIMTAMWMLIILFGTPWLFWMLILLIAALGLREYFRMANGKSPGVPVLLSILASIIPVGVSLFNRADLLAASLFVSLFVIIALSLKHNMDLDSALNYQGKSMLGTLYISFCLSHLVFIRYLPEGIPWLLVLTAVTAGGDSGAYYIGSKFGRRKLCPDISPGKTVEGAIGGIVASACCAVLIGLIFMPQGRVPVIFGAAVLLSVVSILGDLAESVMKRSAMVKDSGTLLFGHGGVLDRIDSLLITGPSLYYLLVFSVL